MHGKVDTAGTAGTTDTESTALREPKLSCLDCETRTEADEAGSEPSSASRVPSPSAGSAKAGVKIPFPEPL